MGYASSPEWNARPQTVPSCHVCAIGRFDTFSFKYLQCCVRLSRVNDNTTQSRRCPSMLFVRFREQITPHPSYLAILFILLAIFVHLTLGFTLARDFVAVLLHVRYA